MLETVKKTVRTVVLIACVALSAFAQDQATRSLAAAIDRAIAQGHTDQAQHALAELLARPQVELEVLLETGAKLAERELFEPARAVFARGVKDYPRNFEMHYNLALADIALRRFEEASAALEGLGELSKEQRLAREYLKGKIYDATGQAGLAERAYTAAFAGAPEQENYALDLGLFYVRQKLYAKAVGTLQAGAKHHPESVYLLLGLGLAQLFGDDPPRAVATCRKILALEPNFGPAQLLLVAGYYMNGENENCVKETAAFIARPGAPPYLYYLHASAMLKLNSKEYAAMLRDLEASNRAIPGCSFCYFALSKVHQEMGDERAAIADLETLVEKVDPQFSQGWYRLTTLYQRAGRQADAARALGKFRAIKTAETDRETEYLRKLFLSAIGGEANR
jgi:tetratricopeptide (TPR) repeat protein